MHYKRYFYQALSVALLALFAVVQAKAQDPDDVIRTETSLVQLNVGVVDKQGRAVTSLTKDDFVVYEDGVKQKLTSFRKVDRSETGAAESNSGACSRPMCRHFITARRR